MIFGRPQSIGTSPKRLISRSSGLPDIPLLCQDAPLLLQAHQPPKFPLTPRYHLGVWLLPRLAGTLLVHFIYGGRIGPLAHCINCHLWMPLLEMEIAEASSPLLTTFYLIAIQVCSRCAPGQRLLGRGHLWERGESRCNWLFVQAEMLFSNTLLLSLITLALPQMFPCFIWSPALQILRRTTGFASQLKMKKCLGSFFFW